MRKRNWLTRVALWVAVGAGLLILLSGPSYQLGWLELGPIFRKLFPAAVYLGGLAIGLSLIGFFLAWRGRGGAISGVLAIVIAAAAMAVPLSIRYQARQVPRIHDISTDLVNPPDFVAIAPLRANAPNAVEYAGNAVAILQREAYPDVQTVRLHDTVENVFAAAQEVVLELGWELHAVDPESGRIEATETTTWFGFKDDVVIRVVAGSAITEVDIRSKSRVGVSDLGVNADRIRKFRNRLVARLL